LTDEGIGELQIDKLLWHIVVCCSKNDATCCAVPRDTAHNVSSMNYEHSKLIPCSLLNKVWRLHNATRCRATKHNSKFWFSAALYTVWTQSLKLVCYQLVAALHSSVSCRILYECTLTVGRISGWEGGNPSSVLEACMGYTFSPASDLNEERPWQQMSALLQTNRLCISTVILERW